MKTTCPTLAKTALALLVTSGFLGFASTNAAVDTWTNTTAANLSNAVSLWSNSAVPVSGDSWIFANVSGGTLANNFLAGFQVNGITFNLGTAAETISGNSINLAGGITNNSANVQTLGTALVLQGNQVINNSLTTGKQKFTGVISDGGSGYGLTFSGLGSSTLTAADTYTGSTIVSGGSLVLTNGGSLANSALTVTNTGYQGFLFTTASNVNTITVTNTTGLNIGQIVTGYGIPAGTTITAISGTTVTLSANNTATNATTSQGNAYTNTGSVIASGATLTNVTVGANTTVYGYSANFANYQGGGSANFIASNSTINGTLTINAPQAINGTNYTATLAANETGTGAGYGWAQVNTGVSASNILVNGRLDVLGSGSLNLTGINGTSNGNSFWVGGGSGAILLNNTYSSANNSGGYGNVLNFTAGSVFAQLGAQYSTAISSTFTQSGVGTTTFGMFEVVGGAPGNSTNNNFTFSGGNWLIGQLGQNNSNQQLFGKVILTNNAWMAITNGSYASGYFTVGNGSTLVFSNVFSTTKLAQGQGAGVTVAGGGTLSIGSTAGTWANAAVSNNIIYITNNGGTVTDTGSLTLGGSLAGTNNNASLTINGGIGNFTNVTLGGAGTAATLLNNSNIITLSSGTLSLSGTLAAGAGTSESNSLVWTGGTLSAGIVTANTGNWSVPGTAIATNTLYNTNGTLWVGNITNGYAGKTTINGNYSQSGSGTTTFNVLGATAPSTWSGSATSYSQLAVSSNVTLNGNIVINFGSYTPVSGTAYNLVTGSSITGSYTPTYIGGNLLNTNGLLFGGDGFSYFGLTNTGTTLAFTNFGQNQWAGGTGTWNTGNTTWSGLNPSGTNLGAYFGTNGLGGAVTVQGAHTVSTLVFSNSTNSYILADGGSSTITINNGTGVGVNITNGAGSNSVASAISIGGNFSVKGTGTLTLSGNISDGGAGYSALFTNSGLVTLSGSNSYSGGTTIGAGTLAIASSSALGTAGVTNKSTILFTGSGASSLNNAISGSGTLTANGSGTLTLGGINTYSGPTLVSNGGLSLAGSLTGSTITVSGGTFSESSTGSVSNNGGATMLTVTNGGNVVLAGSNSWQITNSITTPAIVVNAGGSLSLAGSNALTPSLSVYNPGGTNFGNTATRMTALSIIGGTAYITNSGVNVVLNGGTNISTLNAGVSNNINVNQLVLVTGTGNGATNFVIDNGATFTQNAPAGNSGNSFTLQSNAIMQIGNGTFVANLGSAINANQFLVDKGGKLQIGTSGVYTNTSYSGAFNLGSTTGTNILTNAGTFYLSNALTMNGSGATNQIDNTGTLTVTGTFRMSGGVNTVNLLPGSATYAGIALNGGTNVVTVYGGATNYGTPNVGYNTAGSSNLFVVQAGGVVTNTNNNAILFVGQALSSSVNTLSNNGTISAAGMGFNAQSGNFNVSTVYQAGGSMTLSSWLSFNGGNQTTQGNSNTALLNVTGGTLTVNGVTTIGVAGTNNLNTLQVDGGTANLTSVVMGATNTTAKANTNRVILNGGILTANQFTAGPATAGAGDVNQITFNGGTLQAGSLASNNFLTNGIATVTLNAGGGTIDSSNNSIAVGATISGVGGLRKSGAGTLNLTGANTYQGATVVNSGTLQSVNNANLSGLVVNQGATFVATAVSATPWATGTLGGIAAQLTNATFGVDVSGTNYTLADDLSNGNGGIGFLARGSGTLALASGSVNSGVTNWTVNGATLSVTDVANLKNAPVTLTGTGVLSLDGNSAATLGNDVTVTSGGFTGSIVNNTGFTANLTGTLSKNNAILKLLKGSFNVSGNIVGSSADSDLYVSGASATLSGNNSFNGPTHIDSGATVTLGSTTALPTTTAVTLGSASDTADQVNGLNLAGYSATVAALSSTGLSSAKVYDTVGGGTLTVNGNSTFAGSIGDSGLGNNLSLTVGGGTTTLTGNNSFAGAATVNSGAVLNLGTTGQLSGVSAVNLNGGSLLIGGNNQVNAGANLSMNGGTVSVAASSTGSSFSNLTLTGNSVINFSGLTAGSTLTFTGVVNALNGNTLSVYNWNENDHILFTQGAIASGLTEADLANISFYRDNGTTLANGGTGSVFSGNEIVPVPEPSVILAALMMVALMAFTKREEISRLARRVAIR